MSTTDPRATPTPPDSSRPGGTPETGAAATKAASPAGNGSTPTGGSGVAVATGVEAALAAVQQQLLRQAETVRIETVQVMPAPAPAPAPVPVPAPIPTREVITAAPVRVRELPPEPVLEDDDDYEAEFWGESRRRGTERRIDPKDLPKDERKALGKLKARKVRRIVRNVSPWSVFKFSIFFYLCMWLILMVAGVILWKLAVTSGVVTNIEKFYAKAAGEKSFELDGRSLFRAGASAGAILVLAATAFTVLLAVLFNLITDLTGGVKMTVLELESTRRDLRRRPSSAKVKAKAKPELDLEPDLDVDLDAAAVEAAEALNESARPAVKPAAASAKGATSSAPATTPAPTTTATPSLPRPAAGTVTDKALLSETDDLDWSKSTATAASSKPS